MPEFCFILGYHAKQEKILGRFRMEGWGEGWSPALLFTEPQEKANLKLIS